MELFGGTGPGVRGRAEAGGRVQPCEGTVIKPPAALSALGSPGDAFRRAARASARPRRHAEGAPGRPVELLEADGAGVREGESPAAVEGRGGPR